MTPGVPVLLVGDQSEWRSTVHDYLSHVGFDVTTASSFTEGKWLLTAVRPLVLIAAVRLHAYNGLQLVLWHSFSGCGTSIIIDTEHDPVTQGEAERLGAGYLCQPVRMEQLLELLNDRLAAREAAAASPVQRRWQRTRLASAVPAAIDELRAAIVEVGYGGFQVELTNADAHVPQRFTLRAQGLPSPVTATRVWERRSERPFSLFCGASLEGTDPDAQARWRQSVDAWKAHGARASL